MAKIKIGWEQEILSQIERPAQYIGGEYNSIVKDWEQTGVKMAFLFPDTYEIGMSYLGLRILYEAVNREEGFLLERSFAPMADMEALMRQKKLPLFSWESRRPIKDFDVVGFTLQYELSFTNILNMLDLSGLEVRAGRRQGWPLVIAGGPVAYNPEPLADFIDLFVIGEGEEVLLELLKLVEETKARGGSKEEALEQAAAISGIYVPALYEIQYGEQGEIQAIQPQKGAPKQVLKRWIADFEQACYPTKSLIPHTRAVHDRLALEIMRGCCRGCRFCQAGMIYRPVREKSVEKLLEQGREQVAATGCDEIGLISLSSADYTRINELACGLIEEHQPKGVGVSLPSLRVDAFSVALARQMQKMRKSGLTFAPEAGSQRLRDSINKGINEKEIIQAASAAFAQGWSSVKLYFMLGLPGETDEDILGIAEICRSLIKAFKEHRPPGRGRPLNISLGVGSFVPKSHTPFQWYGQTEAEELRRRQNLLRDAIRPLKAVSLRLHHVDESRLEAAFARGGRPLGRVLEAAWRKGCRFDGWREHFRFPLWLEAFAETGYTIEEFANRHYTYEELLPWAHISCGVKKSWLWQEKEKAEMALTTPDCREGACSDCGVCDSNWGHTLQGAWQGQEEPPPAVPPTEGGSEEKAPAYIPGGAVENPIRWRVRIRVLGAAAWLSHLDLLRSVERALLRAELPLRYSEGFNPHPIISWGPAHPVGLASLEEYFDLDFIAPPEKGWAEKLNTLLAPGLKVEEARPIGLSAPSLMSSLNRAAYEIRFPQDAALDLAAACERILKAEECLILRRSPKKGDKTVNLRPGILELKARDHLVEALCTLNAPGSPKPRELAELLAPQIQGAEILRTALYTEKPEIGKGEYAKSGSDA